MKISYDKDIDYMEIFIVKAENYGESLDDFTTVFKSEKNDEIVGFAFENATKSVFESNVLHLTTKLAAMLKIVRAINDLTQEEAATRIGNITLRHYQRLEAGEDTTLETLERITQAFPNQDFSRIFKKSA